MPTAGIEEVTSAFDFSLPAQSAGAITKDVIQASLDDETAASLSSKCEKFAEQRTVLFDADPGKLNEDEAVFSPIMQSLERLYVGTDDERDPLPLATGRTYVVYAPSKQGKTHGARAFLEDYLPLLEGQDGAEIPTTRGIMITGAPGTDYLTHVAERLGATTGCGSWMFSLIAALCPDRRAADRQPSVLILDALDRWNEINELFVRKLFMATKNKGFHTVILTQNKGWATHMSAMNNGAKILSHPSARSGGTPSEPVWNDLVWTKELLSKMIAMRYPDKATEGWTGDDGLIRWIEHGWTPQDCIDQADRRLLPNPPSPARPA